ALPRCDDGRRDGARARRALSSAATRARDLGVNPIPKLPHGRPLLLIDRGIELGEQRGVFLKHVTAADPCTAPDGTLPAAYVLEALAQAAGALLGAMSEGETARG